MGQVGKSAVSIFDPLLINTYNYIPNVVNIASYLLQKSFFFHHVILHHKEIGLPLGSTGEQPRSITENSSDFLAEGLA